MYLRVTPAFGLVLRWGCVSNPRAEARQLFGAGSAETLRGRGADRSWSSLVSAPERRACWLFGAGGVAILWGRGAESFECRRVQRSERAEPLDSAAVAFGWRWRSRGVRSAPADAGFHSPQAGVFGSTSERGGCRSSPCESRSNDSSRKRRQRTEQSGRWLSAQAASARSASRWSGPSPAALRGGRVDGRNHRGRSCRGRARRRFW